MARVRIEDLLPNRTVDEGELRRVTGGERTPVCDTGDRFGNTYPAYLLVRAENYPSLTLLASNLKK